MPVYNRLTDRSQVSAVTVNDIIHVVVTGDTSQSPQGSSYFAPISFLQPILSGASGTQGTSGTSGLSFGTAGSSGSSGSGGTNGTSGSSGVNGNNGSSGTSGDNGTSGSSGTNGTSGTNGSNGSNGSSGSSGANGISGSSGTSGEVGTSGTAGYVTTSVNPSNSFFFPTFVDSNNQTPLSERLYTDEGLAYNPSTNVLNVGGVAQSGDGAVGSPSYSFTADTNTGIYRLGSDNLGVSTGGARRMSVDSVGSIYMGNGNISTGANFVFPLGAGVTTTDATPTTLLTINASGQSTAYTIEAFVVGGLSTPTSAIGGVITATYVNNAGTLRLVGSIQGSVQEDFAASPTFTFVISGTNINLQVTGVLATSINWYGKVQYIAANLAT